MGIFYLNFCFSARQTKLAYVDHSAKPPRGVRRAQIMNGTAGPVKQVNDEIWNMALSELSSKLASNWHPNLLTGSFGETNQPRWSPRQAACSRKSARDTAEKRYLSRFLFLFNISATSLSPINVVLHLLCSPEGRLCWIKIHPWWLAMGRIQTQCSTNALVLESY